MDMDTLQVYCSCIFFTCPTWPSAWPRGAGGEEGGWEVHRGEGRSLEDKEGWRLEVEGVREAAALLATLSQDLASMSARSIQVIKGPSQGLG